MHRRSEVPGSPASPRVRRFAPVTPPPIPSGDPTADTALRLARYFGGDPQTWLNLQATHDLKIAERDHRREIRKRIEPR
jgi:hypothetical protein